MVRLGVILWPLGIILAAIGLFQVKYSVQAIDAEIRQVDRQLEKLREDEAIMTAEWEYRTQPAALEALAESHLGLRSDAGTIVTSLERLPYRDPGQLQTSSEQTWTSEHRSERLEELPNLGLTGFNQQPQPQSSVDDDLQSLILELEGL